MVASVCNPAPASKYRVITPHRPLSAATHQSYVPPCPRVPIRQDIRLKKRVSACSDIYVPHPRATEKHALSDDSGRMPDSMKDDGVTVRFPAELRRRLKDAALRNGTRDSEIVRNAVERQFAAADAEITAYERAKRAGLIGAVKGLSRDLSMNPKHFDGFGSS